MKQKIISLLKKATALKKEEIAGILEIPPSQELGDYSFPCFTLAKSLKKSPNEISISLSKQIPQTKEIEKVQAVGPYVNFFLNKTALAESTIKKILNEKDKYG